MIHVRPHEIFARFASDDLVTLHMPQGPRELGLTLLETFLLIAVARGVRARQIFEFGTWKGYTTCALGMNVPNVHVVTLDIANRFSCSGWKGPMLALLGDSRHFDFTPWENSVDLVFIDGGHDGATVRADTAHAFQMLLSGGAIAWHDYENLDFPEVTAYLDSLSDVVHVLDTSLVFSFT